MRVLNKKINKLIKRLNHLLYIRHEAYYYLDWTEQNTTHTTVNLENIINETSSEIHYITDKLKYYETINAECDYYNFKNSDR